MNAAGPDPSWNDRLELTLSLATASPVLDRSVDIEVTIKNPQTSAQLVLSPQPLNDAIRFAVSQPERNWTAIVDDDVVRVHRGLRKNSHREPENEILNAGSSSTYVFDLLTYGLDLVPGSVEVIALFPDDGLESEPLRFEVETRSEPALVLGDRRDNAWWDDVGERVWTASTGTFLQGRWNKVPRSLAFDRQVISQPLPRSARLSRPCVPGRTTRHLVWTEPGFVHCQPVDQGLAIGSLQSHSLRGTWGQFLEDPSGRLWGIQGASDGSSLHVVCISQPKVPRLNVTAPASPELATASFDRDGRLHLACMLGRELWVVVRPADSETTGAPPAASNAGQLPGACVWMALDLEPIERGDEVELAATVTTLVRVESGRLQQWVSGADGAAVYVSELDPGAGQLVDVAHDRRGDVHVLVEHQGQLSYVNKHGARVPSDVDGTLDGARSRILVSTDPERHAVLVTAWNDRRGVVLWDVTC